MNYKHCAQSYVVETAFLENLFWSDFFLQDFYCLWGALGFWPYFSRSGKKFYTLDDIFHILLAFSVVFAEIFSEGSSQIFSPRTLPVLPMAISKVSERFSLKISTYFGCYFRPQFEVLELTNWTIAVSSFQWKVNKISPQTFSQ